MRALVLGSRRRERDALARSLAAAGARVRVERAFESRPIEGVEDSVVLDAADAEQVIEAARGCNVLYHVARPAGAARGAAVARSLARVARESLIARIIVVSDAATLIAHAGGVTSSDRGVPGRGWPEEVEGLYALERSLARAAADGLHASVLLPGYVWHEGEENAVEEARAGSGRLTVASAATLNATLIAMSLSARAGARYTLGGARTWSGDWRAWLAARGELGGEDPSQLTAAAGDRWLDGEDVARDLRMSPPASLGALTGGQ